MSPRNPESGSHAPEPKEQIDALELRKYNLQEASKKLRSELPSADLARRGEIADTLEQYDKDIAKVSRDAEKLRKQLERQAKRINSSAEEDEEEIARHESRISKHKKRLAEVNKELAAIELKFQNPDSMDANEIKELTSLQMELQEEKLKLAGEGDEKGKIDRVEDRADRQVKFGRFGKEKAKDLKQLKAEAKQKRTEAQSRLTEIAEMKELGLGEDIELLEKEKQAQKEIGEAEEVLKQEDKGEQVEEGLEDIETNNERMVRITVNLAQYLSVNPPIEGEMLDGEVIQTNLAEFAFIFTLKRAGQDGLKAIQDQLGDDNLQKLKDTMGFVIKEGYNADGDPELVYEFDDNLKDPNVIAKIKEQREGASIKDPKAKALERSGGEMKKLAKESMKSILSSEDLYAKMKGQGIGMDSSLFDFFDKALADEASAKAKITSLYQNKHVLDSVRESIQGLEGDKLNTALEGLGIDPEAYQDAASDELTDEELRTLLTSAGMAKDMPMFKGITVGDVVKDLYRNGDESMREKLRTEFAEDKKATEIFDAQDELEGRGLKDIARDMIQAAKDGDSVYMRDLIVNSLIEDKDNLPKNSGLTGSSLLLDLLMVQSIEDPDLSLSVDDKIKLLSDSSQGLIEDSEAQKILSDDEYSNFIEQYLLSVKDMNLNEVYDLQADQALDTIIPNAEVIASVETTVVDASAGTMVSSPWNGVNRFGPPPVDTGWQ